jgi:N-acyl-L-homoserine lactone synthetase
VSVEITFRGWTFGVHEVELEDASGYRDIVWVVRARWGASARNRYEYRDAFDSYEKAHACLRSAVRAMMAQPRLSPSQSPRWTLVREDGERVAQLPLYAAAPMPG